MVTSKRPLLLRNKSHSCSMTGVWRAVGRNEGAAVIFHSPRACGHVAHDMDVSIQTRAMARRFFAPAEYEAPLVCSNLQEEHSIFGGCDLLRQCIDDTVQKYKPQYIVIVNSCVAGVIGDDSEAAARQAEQDWNLPIMAVPCHSFLDGDFYVGFYHAGRVLAERFMAPQPKNPRLAVLIGERGGPKSPDMQEIRRLLAYFDFTDICLFPAYASLQDIRRVPSASLLIPLGGSQQAYPWMSKLAADLQEMWQGVRLDHDYPAGWQASRSWLREIGRICGCQETAEKAVQAEEQKLEQSLCEIRTLLQGKSVVFCIGRPSHMFDWRWILELIQLARLQLSAVVILEESLSVAQQSALREQLAEITDSPTVLSSVAQDYIDRADFVVTTHELTEERKRQFLLPMQPPAGVNGLLGQMQAMVRLSQRYGARGGVFYG